MEAALLPPLFNHRVVQDGKEPQRISNQPPCPEVEPSLEPWIWEFSTEGDPKTSLGL